MLDKINVLTCDYIDFYKLEISQEKKTCETDAGQKSMYSHEYIDFCLAHVTTLTVIYKMYKNCAITFNLHDKLFHRVATIVVFNNGSCRYVRALS